MNDLQKKELELLECFIGVCEKLNLKYYLVCGSALGAVKYGGFIPWDDDVDVALPREDYEIFCEKAQELLPDGLFIQNYHSEPECPFLYSKLRNSNTTYIEKSSAKLPINHGIFIDIFPLDGCPEGKLRKWLLSARKNLYKRQLACVFDVERKGKTYIIYKINRILGFHKKTGKILKKLERIITRYHTEKSKIWCNHGNWQGNLEYAPKEQYGNGEESAFEGIKVIIPEQSDNYLRQKYGDYSKEPENKDVPHECLVCDLEKSYLNYL